MKQQKKRALGRPIEALISDIGQEVLEQPQVEVLKQIDVARIRAGIYQPRRHFDEEALNELAQSIAEHGILQPLVVRPIEGDHYEIIAGERRFRAGQQAGLSKVPCVVRPYNDRQALAIALIENLQRSDLNVLEVAHGLQRLAEDFSLTHENIAQLVGRSRSGVVGVQGSFVRGELVAVCDRGGNEIARGLSNYGDSDARRLIGQPSSRIESILGFIDETELVHRDNLVLR